MAWSHNAYASVGLPLLSRMRSHARIPPSAPGERSSLLGVIPHGTQAHGHMKHTHMARISPEPQNPKSPNLTAPPPQVGHLRGLLLPLHRAHLRPRAPPPRAGRLPRGLLLAAPQHRARRQDHVLVRLWGALSLGERVLLMGGGVAVRAGGVCMACCGSGCGRAADGVCEGPLVLLRAWTWLIKPFRRATY